MYTRINDFLLSPASNLYKQREITLASSLTNKEKKFVSFTDCEFDENVDHAVEFAKNFWPEMKKHGAINMRTTVTGEKY